MNCPRCGNQYDTGEEICLHCGSRLPVATKGYLAPGTVLRGRYEIEAEAPKVGGMGIIYFAVDRQAEGKPCVVKQVKQRVTSDDILWKLQEEARRMAALSRAIGGRIPEILEDFVDDGHFYVIQQRIFGKTLEEIFQENRPLAEDEVIGWAIQCCRLLHSIHNYKDHPVHRDISPDNLMLTPMGDIMFIDFGTLREFQRIAKGTAGLGKFGYTPPEQWKGRPVPQSDIFALGATIYFLLTGFLPHSDELKNGKSPQLSDYEPIYPPIRTKNQKVSRELERILLRALDIDISKRYLAAEQMMIELDKLPKPKPTTKPMMPLIREPVLQTSPADVPVVLCPKCGQPNEPHLVYCKYDEAVLYDGTQKCPKCGRPVPINAKFCPRDGTPMITKSRE